MEQNTWKLFTCAWSVELKVMKLRSLLVANGVEVCPKTENNLHELKGDSMKIMIEQKGSVACRFS